MQEQNRHKNGRISSLVLSCWMDFDDIKYERFVTEGNPQSVEFKFAKTNKHDVGDSGNCEEGMKLHFPQFGIRGN